MFPCTKPRGPNDQKIQARLKFSVSIEMINLARKFQSRRLEFPTKNWAAAGGSLKNFSLARNFQCRSKSRIFLIFGSSGKTQDDGTFGCSPVPKNRNEGTCARTAPFTKLPFCFPKGPFRTKNAMAPKTVVFYS